MVNVSNIIQKLVSVHNSLQMLGKQRAMQQVALQKVMDKAKAWDDKNQKFDARKELQAILDDTMEVDRSQDETSTNGSDITKE